MERDAIAQALLEHNGNKARAARSLGMSRATIYRKIHEYEIVIPSRLTELTRPQPANSEQQQHRCPAEDQGGRGGLSPASLAVHEPCVQ
jgi:transposase